MAGRIVVGTGGWSAEEWYPPGLAARDRLGWYAERFEGVEVDSTFYAIPARRTVTRWAKVMPDGFTFDVKLHRLLSRHAAPPSSLPRDLRRQAEINERGRVILSSELEEAVCGRTLEAMAPLLEADAVSSFLLQLTPGFAPAEHRLDELEPVVQALAPVPVAIELRHRDWLNDSDATLDGFRALGAGFVCVDAPAVDAPIVLPPFDAVTRDDLAYLRAHGRNAKGYLRGAARASDSRGSTRTTSCASSPTAHAASPTRRRTCGSCSPTPGTPWRPLGACARSSRPDLPRQPPARARSAARANRPARRAR